MKLERHRVKRRYGTPVAVDMLRQIESENGFVLGDDVLLQRRGNELTLAMVTVERAIQIIRARTDAVPKITLLRNTDLPDKFYISIGSEEPVPITKETFVGQRGAMSFYEKDGSLCIEFDIKKYATPLYDLLCYFTKDDCNLKVRTDPETNTMALMLKKIPEPPDPAYA